MAQTRPLRTVLLAATTALAVALGAGTASATVTRTYHPETQRLEVAGDGAADSIALTCNANAVLLNGVDTTADCDDIRGFDINLGNGVNSANLTGVTAAAFTNLGDQQHYTGGTGPDTYTGATSAHFPIGAEDVVNMGGGNDTVVGNIGDDVISGGAGINDVDGGAGTDTVKESAATDGALFSSGSFYFGPDRDDVTGAEVLNFTGGPNADTISAGDWTGKVSFNGAGGGDFLIGGPDDDALSGGDGDDDIDGNGGEDWVAGQGHTDTIHGGPGNDTLSGGGFGNPTPGADQVHGDADNDSVDIRQSTAGADAFGDADIDTFTVNQSIAQGVDGGSGVGDTIHLKDSITLSNTSFGPGSLANVEKATVDEAVDVDAHSFTGSLTIQAKQNATSNFIGSQGPNKITTNGGGGDVRGGPSADHIVASGATVRGGGGADTLIGGGANTMIEDNVGSATLTPTKLDRVSGADVTITNFGTVVLNGTASGDVINATTRDSKVEIYGGGGDDTLTGSNVYADKLDAGTGVDTLNGLGGNDVFMARNTAATTINCGAGASDTGERDAIDTTNACESVLAPLPPGTNPPGTEGPGQQTTPPPPVTPGAARFGAFATKVRKGRFTVAVACAGDTACSGGLKIRTAARKPLTLANKAFTIAPGTSKVFTVRLGTAARKRLAAAGRKGLRAKATLTLGGQTASKTVTLKPAR